jgi:hypothetical protein
MDLPNPTQIREIKIDSPWGRQWEDYVQSCVNITRLTLKNSTYCQHWVHLADFSKLEKLSIKSSKYCVTGAWPAKLKIVKYHGNFDAALPTFPHTLVKLDLGAGCQQVVLRDNVFPPSLECLSIGTENFPYGHALCLPSSLTQLKLCCDQKLVTPGTLPTRLSSLTLINTRAYSNEMLCQDALGSSLLGLSYRSSSDLDLDNLPPSLTVLRVQLSLERSWILGIKFPVGLVKLVLYNNSRRVFSTFPDGLRKLKLYYDNYLEIVDALRLVVPAGLKRVGFFTRRPHAFVFGWKKPPCDWISLA